MSDLSRRRLLAVAGTGLAGAIAGCSSDDDGDESDDESETEPAEGDTESETTDVEGTILGEITVDNLDDASHTVDVLVEFGREIEEWATENVAADSGTTLERNWPTDPGAFRVTVRLDQGEPIQVTPAKWNDPDCLNLFARIDREGELTLLSDTDGGPCGDGDADISTAEE